MPWYEGQPGDPQLTGIDIQGIDEVMAKLEKLPEAVKGMAADEVMKYLKNVVQAYPSYKYVSRKQAFGKTFFSDKQRRWFFAALDSGELTIPYKRTQGFRRSWQLVGEGESTILVNPSDYGEFLVGDMEGRGQSRHMKLIGWKTMPTIIKEKTSQILRKAEAGAKKGLRKIGVKDI